MTPVTVVIVSFNTRDELVRCVSEVVAVANTEVIVVDNGSVDGSADAIASQFPTVRLIRNLENVGFAKAVNQGLVVGAGTYFMLLNSDTFDVQDAIPRLAAYLDAHRDVGIVAAQQRNLDGSLQPTGRSAPSRWNEVFWNLSLFRIVGMKGPERFFDPSRNYQRTSDVETVPAACLMTSRTMLKRVGMLDDRFFFCYEDIDFCNRVSAAGFRIVYLAEAKITHAWGVSAKKAGPALIRKYIDGYFYYLRKWHGRPFELLMRVLIVVKTSMTLPFAALRGTEALRRAIDIISVGAGRRP